MLHAKFQDHRTSGSGEEDFKGFNHILAWRPFGHVTRVIYNFGTPFTRRLHIKRFQRRRRLKM